MFLIKNVFSGYISWTSLKSLCGSSWNCQILFVGSFATATCMACKHKVSADEVREDIFNQVQDIVG